MPFRRRQDGLTASDRRLEEKLWRDLLAFLAIVHGLAANAVLNGPLIIASLVVATALLTRVTAMRVMIWQPHGRINKVVKLLVNCT